MKRICCLATVFVIILSIGCGGFNRNNGNNSTNNNIADIQSQEINEFVAEEEYIQAFTDIVNINAVVELTATKIASSYVKSIENKDTDGIFWYPFFTDKEDLITFSEYKRNAEENPGSLSEKIYQVMTEYFNIQSQKDLDNWVNLANNTLIVADGLPDYAKVIVSHKEEIDEDCFDYMMEYYETTKNMKDYLFPDSSEDMPDYLEALASDMEKCQKLSEKIDMYIDIDNDSFQEFLTDMIQVNH